MSQLPDPTNPAEAVNAALGGIKQALKAGKDIQQTATEVNQFLDAEARARVAFKKRQQQIARRGDTIWVDARAEWDIIRQMREAEAAMYREVEREFGRTALSEVKALIIRMRREHRELNDEFYRKRIEVRREWGVLLLLAAIIYGIFKQTGVW